MWQSFCFLFPKRFFILNLALASSNFWSPKSVWYFYQHRPNISSGVLLNIHIGIPKVHFIRLEGWFYGNGILKCDKVLVFNSPKKKNLNLAFAIFNFWRPKVPVPFLSEWANFMEWCTACYVFWHPQSQFY